MKNGGKGRSPPRVCWCFTMKADCQDRDNEDAFNTQAEWIVGQLIDHCEKYVFQLECSPTTGYYP